jgi:hypothetical protein
LDPPLRGAGCAGVAEGDVAVVAVPVPLPAVALTIPYAPPPIAMAAAPIASGRVSLQENMDCPFVVCRSFVRG